MTLLVTLGGALALLVLWLAFSSPAPAWRWPWVSTWIEGEVAGGDAYLVVVWDTRLCDESCLFVLAVGAVRFERLHRGELIRGAPWAIRVPLYRPWGLRDAVAGS